MYFTQPTIVDSAHRFSGVLYCVYCMGVLTLSIMGPLQLSGSTAGRWWRGPEQRVILCFTQMLSVSVIREPKVSEHLKGDAGMSDNKIVWKTSRNPGYYNVRKPPLQIPSWTRSTRQGPWNLWGTEPFLCLQNSGDSVAAWLFDEQLSRGIWRLFRCQQACRNQC